MTRALKKESFDIHTAFKKAVKTARKMYPTETAGVTFLNAQNRDTYKVTLKQWIRDNFDTEDQKRIYKQTLLAPSSGVSISSKTDNKALIYKDFNKPFLSDPMKEFMFSFWHEMGHIVDPDVRAEEDSPSLKEFFKARHAAESVADSFAIYHGLKQKFLNKKDIQHIANRRLEIVEKEHGIEYHTAPLLTEIQATFKHKHVVSLSPKEIKQVAIDHAKCFPLDNDLIKKMQNKILAKTFGIDP